MTVRSAVADSDRDWKLRFFTIWVGQACSLVGSALVRFALIWWLTERTGSPTVLTTASVASLLPVIALGPFAGAFVDRWDRRRVMIISDGLIALLTAFLAYLYWLEIIQVWHVYAILFLRALGDVFQSPAMRAATSLMVPKHQLTRVGGMNETLQGVVNIVSPPMGALLLELLSIQATLAVDVITAVMAIGPLLFLSVPQPDAGNSPSEGSTVLRDMAEGFRYVWNWRGIRFLFIVLGAVRFLLVPSFTLLPLLVTEYYGGEVLELGWINSAHGFGFVAGGFILSLWGGFRRQTLTALIGLAGVGFGMVAFGLVPANAFWLAVVIMFLRTSMVPIVRGPILAIFQIHVPPELQGRVFTLLVSAMSVMAPLGLAIGGPIAEAFGVRSLFILAGLGCLLIALIWVSSPTIMHLEDQPRRYHQSLAN